MAAGEIVRRADQQYDPPLGSVAPGGRAGILRARKVIIVGPGGELFVYSPTAGAGNLIYSIAAQSGTDPYGNQFLQGATSYHESLTTGAVQVLSTGIIFHRDIQVPGVDAAGSLQYVGTDNVMMLTPATGNVVGMLLGGQPLFADSVILIPPSGDTTGATDAANFAAALVITKVIWLTAGNYYLNSTITGTSGQYIRGAGRWATFVNWVGTGDVFYWVDSTTYTTRTVDGGGVSDLTIKAITGYTSPSTGFHAGDILNLRFDLTVTGFGGTGDIGVFLDNENFWTEQAIGIAYINGCTKSVVFNCGTSTTTSTGSFDRGDFTFFLSQTVVGADVVTFQNGAQMVGGRLRMYGNINSQVLAFTAAVLKLTGTTPAGHSPVTHSGLECEIDINVESDLGLATTYQTVNFGAATNLINECWGNMNFGDGFLFQQSNASVAAQHIFQGPVVGDPVLAQQTIINRLAVDSQQFWFAHVSSESSGGASTPAVAAGTEASAATIGTRSSDTAGTITITANVGAVAGQLAVVTFNTPYTNTPTISVVPVNLNAATAGVYATSGTASLFDINCANNPASGGTLVVNYMVIGQDS